MKIHALLATVSCCLIAALPTPAATLTNVPVADAYFETYGSETKNFGASSTLKIDQWGGRQTFLRFSLSNVPPSKRLLRATLRLCILERGFNEQGEFSELKTCVGIYDVATPWTEAGLTYRSPDGTAPWNQGPGIPGGKYGDVGPLPKPDMGVRLRRPAIALDPAPLTNGGWVEIDLTQFTRESLRNARAQVDLLLRSSTLGRNYTFHSREAERTDRRPQLVLSLADDLPDMQLEAPFVTNWKPSQSVAVRLKGLESADKRQPYGQWGTEKKPQTSGSAGAAFKAGPGGASFVPETPGAYRVRFEAPVPGKPGETTSEVADVFVLSVPPHPRLYVTADSLPRIREQARGGARLTKGFLDWTENGSRGAGQGKFHDMGLHEGCEHTALAWLITGDRRYLSNSIAYAQRILKKPMREHFTDVHAATFLGAAWVHGMAVHYDWCYDQLPEAHRREVREWLKEAARWAWVRSSAPIAHNDGGARQCLLTSAALALLGDDAEAQELFRLSHQNFTENLLPWLNDGGRGGRSGDGGEYEGLHGFYIVRHAWMSQTATGADVFSESPFFLNRLMHILYGWYPRPLVERNGAYSMRQYYSPSGDHIRMGYVGDTQPYQSAAALCARYRKILEAHAVRWLAGDWPTQWMQYTLRWAVLGEFESIPARPPLDSLGYADWGCNTVYLRSDWTDDATWILFENAPFVSAHGSLDSGTFEIFKGDLLAARTGNLDHANVGAKHTMNYLHRTIAGNCLLVLDPEEKWKGFLGGAEGGQDGGGQRTNFPLGSSPDAAEYVTYRDLFLRGRLTAFTNTASFAYAAANLTPAYNNPAIHGGKLNRPKVSHVGRELLYLRELDSLIVFDRVHSLEPAFKKTWLLHSLGDLEVLDGNASRVDEGEFHYSGATRAVIRHGWPKPVPSFGRCLSVTLLPENPRFALIGGRETLPEGQTAGFPGDQWHGKHQHRHIKDFWVNGTNYPPGNPPESRWFGEPGSKYFVPGTPDETAGRGKWRLEVTPPDESTNAVFFHVLCPRLGTNGAFPDVQRLAAPAGWAGGLLSEAGRTVAFFFPLSTASQTAFAGQLPADFKGRCYLGGLRQGRYQLSTGAAGSFGVKVLEPGLLEVKEATGRVELRAE